MVATPYAVLGGISFMVYRGFRAAKRKALDELARQQPTASSAPEA